MTSEEATSFEPDMDSLERAMRDELVGLLASGMTPAVALRGSGYSITEKMLSWAATDPKVQQLVRLEQQRRYPNLNSKQIEDKIQELELRWAIDFAYMKGNSSAAITGHQVLLKHRQYVQQKNGPKELKQPTLITEIPVEPKKRLIPTLRDISSEKLQ